MRYAILIWILAISLELNAQDLSESDFKKTTWTGDFKNWRNSESDTITLNRILKFSRNGKSNHIADKFKLNENRDLIQLKVKGNGALTLEFIDSESYINLPYYNNWSWKFDSGRQILNLYHENKLHTSLLINFSKKDSLSHSSKKKYKRTNHRLDYLILNMTRLKT